MLKLVFHVTNSVLFWKKNLINKPILVKALGPNIKLYQQDILYYPVFKDTVFSTRSVFIAHVDFSGCLHCGHRS